MHEVVSEKSYEYTLGILCMVDKFVIFTGERI